MKKIRLFLILFLSVSCSLSHAEDEAEPISFAIMPDDWSVIDGGNAAQRLLNRREVDVPAYAVLNNNPWLKDWNAEDVMQNSLLSRAIVAASTRRRAVWEHLRVNEAQVAAAWPLVQADANGLYFISDEEFALLKKELGFGAKNLFALKEEGLSQYMLNLHLAYRFDRNIMTQEEWRRLGDDLSLELLGMWDKLEDEVADLILPDGNTLLSTRSLLMESLLALPLTRGNFNTIEGLWLNTLVKDFEELVLYGDKAKSEYNSHEGMLEEDLIDGELVLSVWEEEIESIMSAKLSMKRGQAIIKILQSNSQTNKISGKRHPARSYFSMVLAEALAKELQKRPSLFKQYLKKLPHFEMEVVAQWIAVPELLSHEKIGPEVTEYVLNTFSKYWESVYTGPVEYIQDKEYLPNLFEDYLKVQSLDKATIELEKVIIKLLSESKTTPSDVVAKLYELRKKHAGEPNVGSIVSAYILGSLNLKTELTEELYKDYEQVVRADQALHYNRMENLLSQDMKRMPSQRQYNLFYWLSDLDEDRAQSWKDRFDRKIVHTFIETDISRDQIEFDPAEKNYQRVRQIIEAFRGRLGTEYKAFLLELRNKIQEVESGEMKTGGKYRKELSEFIDRNLRLFASDLPESLCNSLFD